MLDTILLFVFVLFSVLGFFISAVAVLLKISAPKGKDRFFLVALPSGEKREYILRIRWLQAVLTVTGLSERITIAAVDENTSEDGIEKELSDEKNIIILKNG